MLTEHTYSSLKDNKDSIVLFIDLKKTFDTVNQKTLIDKLGVNGI